MTFYLVFLKPTADYTVSSSQGTLEHNQLTPDRSRVSVRDARLQEGPPATRITLRGATSGSFYLRDVRPGRPIVAPALGWAVTAEDDSRTFVELAAATINPPGAVIEPVLERVLSETPSMQAPVWLGLGGDARIFQVSPCEDHGCWGVITPWHFHHRVKQGENYDVEWDFTVGTGSPYRHQITSRLEDVALPIVHSEQVEESLVYEVTLLATTDTGDMARNPPRGTSWQAAYLSTMGCMFDEGRREELQNLYEEEVTKRSDQSLCCLRVKAKNTGTQPAYAWYRMPAYKPNWLPPQYPPYAEQNQTLQLDATTGLCHEGERIFSINRLNGAPLPHEEMAVLVEPGETCVFECLLPFRPLPPERANVLRPIAFDDLLDDCRTYWNSRLAAFPRWELPEKHWEQRLCAANQHFMMNLLGERLASNTPLLATVGVYAPIGTESTPILWHFGACGRHDLVARCLDYFFEIQRSDGYIQSFNHYDAETGPVLALAHRHFLLTGDRLWLKRILPSLKLAAHYLVKRRRRTMAQDRPNQPGYGMLSGKTADPDEFFHQFVLNAQAIAGLRGAATLLSIVNDPDAEISVEAEALAEATRCGLAQAWQDAPLVPTLTGEWVPFMGSWPGLAGETSLLSEPGRWFTHGTFHQRAASVLHLACFGLVPADDPRIQATMRALETHVLRDFTGPSQPYGKRTDYCYAAMGRREEFLQLFYRQNSKLQDRETLTFWEHYYKLSSQKTHEEAWFIQQLTWLFCFEEEDGLSLMKLAPSTWFAPGACLDIPELDTTWGRISLRVRGTTDTLEVTLTLKPGAVRTAGNVAIRLPAETFVPPTIGRYNLATQMLALGPGPLDITFAALRREVD